MMMVIRKRHLAGHKLGEELSEPGYTAFSERTYLHNDHRQRIDIRLGRGFLLQGCSLGEKLRGAVPERAEAASKIYEAGNPI